MKCISSIDQLKLVLGSVDSGSLGLVPTMGALHEGHLSLIRESVSDNSITVVSIFVNPTQFNDPDDLRNYPRNTEEDLALLKHVLSDSDIVFTPETDDIYDHEETLDIDLGSLDKVMEGKHRPGHFEGVVRIVNILFRLVQPSRAYFGQKDFQQLSVIKSMSKQTGNKVKIIACPIIREENGLAMSSRNKRLDPENRKNAGIIYSTLLKYSSPGAFKSPRELKKAVIDEISCCQDFSVEYFDVVDDEKLQSLKSFADMDPDKSYYACIAVFTAGIRLIDNNRFSFPV